MYSFPFVQVSCKRPQTYWEPAFVTSQPSQKCPRVTKLSTNNSDNSTAWESCHVHKTDVSQPPLCTFTIAAEVLFFTRNTNLTATGPAVFTGCTCVAYCFCKKTLSGRQRHLSLLGRHKELRLTVRYTRPPPELGWSEHLPLTAAHTAHTDAHRRRDGFSEEENANFSLAVNDRVWMDRQLRLVTVISSPRNNWCNLYSWLRRI